MCFAIDSRVQRYTSQSDRCLLGLLLIFVTCGLALAGSHVCVCCFEQLLSSQFSGGSPSVPPNGILRASVPFLCRSLRLLHVFPYFLRSPAVLFVLGRRKRPDRWGRCDDGPVRAQEWRRGWSRSCIGWHHWHVPLTTPPGGRTVPGLLVDWRWCHTLLSGMAMSPRILRSICVYLWIFSEVSVCVSRYERLSLGKWLVFALSSCWRWILMSVGW
jgi:hypothetical protein